MMHTKIFPVKLRYGQGFFIAVFSTILMVSLQTEAATPQSLQEPPVFASQNGTLNVLMIAAKRPSVTVPAPSGALTSDFWTYEVCYLPAPGANACPAGTGQSGLGGVRLALQPGDTMTIRLINNLPIVTDADHIADNPYLINNPTNLHTHGLIVEPHRAVGPSDTYGDYVFVEVTNPQNKAVPQSVTSVTPVHPGMDVAKGSADYSYHIETTHPPGLFWFHPHLHGLSLNQVTAGMAGDITVGQVADECGDNACVNAVNQSMIRHIILKDTQIDKGGILRSQPDPGYCDGAPATPRQGTCAGQGDFAGGTWLHTLNGQAYPQITVGGSGEVWRILNAAGSRSYQLSVTDNATNRPLPLQVIAIDGITLGAVSNTDPSSALWAGKLTPIPCPGQSAAGENGLLCASTVRMMPSARIEVRLVRTDPGPTPQAATLRTAQYDTGSGALGDHWPAIDLASVTLSPRYGAVPDVVALKNIAQVALSPAGQLLAAAILQVPGTSETVAAVSAGTNVATPAAGAVVQPDLVQAATAAITPQLAVAQVADAKCKPLAAGHHRKILFGYPTATTFGLGYVEVDQDGADIEATRIPITEFDPTQEMVCVPLNAGAGVRETWELVNLTPEDHNFHIHQTHFRVLANGTTPGTTIPVTLNQDLVLVDNVPVPRPVPAANAAACDGTLAQVKSGACKPSTTVVEIPFREIGDFVFHCHILEHEDGGMMARIRVVVRPTT